MHPQDEAIDASQPCRVVIVDDHAMVRQSITLALERADGLDVVAAVGSAAEGREAVNELRPHVGLFDYTLPDGTGVDLARELHAGQPGLRTVILTAAEGIQAAAEAIEAGCAGFVRKSADLGELAGGLRRVCEGEALFDSETLSAAIEWMNRPQTSVTELTVREVEVLQLLAEGRSTRDISEELVLSHHTVRNHVRNILTKLFARSQLEAVVIAAGMGIVEVGPRA